MASIGNWAYVLRGAAADASSGPLGDIKSLVPADVVDGDAVLILCDKSEGEPEQCEQGQHGDHDEEQSAPVATGGSAGSPFEIDVSSPPCQPRLPRQQTPP